MCRPLLFQGPSQLPQWQRICLPMQEMPETWVWSLGWEDPLEKGNPLQYSCLEKPMGRGAWWATVCGITKSQTRLSAHTHTAVPVPASGTEERQTLIPPGPPRHPDVAKLHVCVELCPWSSHFSVEETSSQHSQLCTHKPLGALGCQRTHRNNPTSR